MVNNNSGGEKSLEFGKTENYIMSLNVVLSDGHEYTLGPLDRRALDVKMKQTDFEGEVYRKTFALVDGHYNENKAAKPHVSKNSTGYNILGCLGSRDGSIRPGQSYLQELRAHLALRPTSILGWCRLALHPD